jgi:hypothetical protein
MQKLVTSGLVAVACTLLAPACDGSEACGCTPAPEVTGTVTGVVFMPDSTPIALARVELGGTTGECLQAGDETWSYDETAGDGSYDVYFEFHGVGDDDVCVVIQAFPPVGLAFGPSEPLTLIYAPDDLHLGMEEQHDFYLTD